MKLLQCGRFELDLSTPRIMAIINLTTDSFSGDGRGADIAAALDHAEQAIEAGAELLDIGAESTRPGAEPASEEQEGERIEAFLQVAAAWQLPISVDTMKPAVMRRALAAGADMINDINGFRSPGAIEVVANSQAALCVMHMQGEPRTMQLKPHYQDVCAAVQAFFADRVAALDAAGVGRERIVLDPGFGFGKLVGHNFSLLREFGRLSVDELPMLAGLSRKSMLGAVTGREVRARLPASLAAALIAVQRGAAIVRVHDVAATRDVLQVWQALEAC